MAGVMEQPAVHVAGQAIALAAESLAPPLRDGYGPRLWLEVHEFVFERDVAVVGFGRWETVHFQIHRRFGELAFGVAADPPGEFEAREIVRQTLAVQQRVAVHELKVQMRLASMAGVP